MSNLENLEKNNLDCPILNLQGCKNYDAQKKKKEKMMLDEVAYPFYLETLAKSNIDCFFDGQEKPEKVYQKIKEEIMRIV